MIIAIWIIAICEVVRAVQNAVQLLMMRGNNDKYNTACDEFVKSLKNTDKVFVRGILKKLEEYGADEETGENE